MRSLWGGPERVQPLHQAMQHTKTQTAHEGANEASKRLPLGACVSLSVVYVCPSTLLSTRLGTDLCSPHALALMKPCGWWLVVPVCTRRLFASAGSRLAPRPERPS